MTLIFVPFVPYCAVGFLDAGTTAEPSFWRLFYATLGLADLALMASLWRYDWWLD